MNDDTPDAIEAGKAAAEAHRAAVQQARDELQRQMGQHPAPSQFLELTPEQRRARGRRNLVIGLALVAFVVLVFFVSMARMTQNMHANHAVAGATT